MLFDYNSATSKITIVIPGVEPKELTEEQFEFLRNLWYQLWLQGTWFWGQVLTMRMHKRDMEEVEQRKMMQQAQEMIKELSLPK